MRYHRAIQRRFDGCEVAKAGGGKAIAAGAIAQEPGSGRFIGSSGLTEKQQAFVSLYVANGAQANAAARSAGYAGERDGWRLMRNEAVLAAIRAELERKMMAEGAAVGLGVLLDVAADKGQSGAARTMAAKELLRLGGYGRENVPTLEDKPLSERTLAELDAFIGGGTARLAELHQQEMRTIDGETQRITHSSAHDPLDDL
jgi:phage terminase small subunit